VRVSVEELFMPEDIGRAWKHVNRKSIKWWGTERTE